MEDRIKQARGLVGDVLSGLVTPENDLHVFDDDLLYFAVGTLRQHPAELEWLQNRLKEKGPGASLVAACLPPPTK